MINKSYHPKFASTLVLLEKMHIYSFGAFLFEAICHKHRIMKDLEPSNDNVHIVECVIFINPNDIDIKHIKISMIVNLFAKHITPRSSFHYIFRKALFAPP